MRFFIVLKNGVQQTCDQLQKDFVGSYTGFRFI